MPRTSVMLAVLAISGALSTGCDSSVSEHRFRVSQPPPTAVETLARPMLEVDTVLRDLRVPWGLARTENGTLFVSERSGRILALPPDSDSAALWATLDVYSEEPGIGSETGLLGIAMLPGTDSAPVLYARATTWRTKSDRSRGLGMRLWRRLAGRVRADGALKFKNQVLRLERLRTGAIRRTVIVDDLATNHYHAGGGPSRSDRMACSMSAWAMR